MKKIIGLVTVSFLIAPLASAGVVIGDASSQAALLLTTGGRVVASTGTTVFIRAANGQLFECDAVDGSNMFKGSKSLRVSGLSGAKRISSCHALGEW